MSQRNAGEAPADRELRQLAQRAASSRALATGGQPGRDRLGHILEPVQLARAELDMVETGRGFARRLLGGAVVAPLCCKRRVARVFRNRTPACAMMPVV